MREITLKIDGMRCNMCEEHVNNEIRKLIDVKKVKSNHLKGETVLVTKQDDIDIDKLINGINATGYKVLSFENKEYTKKGLFSFLKK